MAKQKMSEQDKKDWDTLYDYVRYNVLEYDSNQSLSKAMVLRLKGLLSNKFMENSNIENTANYSYITILNTFKFCMPDIQRGLHNNSFRDEMHKFNYVLKIVESRINDVYVRMKNANKAKDKTETLDMSTVTHNSGAKYQHKTETTSNNKLDDLW